MKAKMKSIILSDGVKFLAHHHDAELKEKMNSAVDRYLSGDFGNITEVEKNGNTKHFQIGRYPGVFTHAEGAFVILGITLKKATLQMMTEKEYQER